MARSSSYVAVYDVSGDRERERVAKVLEGFGLRVQYSAFELRLTPATRQTLMRRLEELKLATGFVYLYRRAGGRDRAAVGCVPDNPLGEDRHAFVLFEEAAPPRGNRRNERKPNQEKPPLLPQPATPLSTPVLSSSFGLVADTATNGQPALGSRTSAAALLACAHSP